MCLYVTLCKMLFLSFLLRHFFPKIKVLVLHFTAEIRIMQRNEQSKELMVKMLCYIPDIVCLQEINLIKLTELQTKYKTKIYNYKIVR